MLKRTKGEKIFNAFNILVLSLFSLAFIIPYLMVFATSVSDELSILKDGYTLLPKGFTLNAYKFVFESCPILVRAFLNSTGLLLVGVPLCMLIQFLMGYALSKKFLPGYKLINFLVVFTMMFSGGLVPTYLLVRSLGMYDSYLAMIIPGLCSSYNIVLIRNYFQGQSVSLEEASLIDGASYWQCFWRIALPTAKPLLATIGVFSLVSSWNSWYTAMLYLNDPNKYPIQMVVREMYSNFAILVENATALGGNTILPTETAKMAVVIVASLPIILVYPFLQKYFVHGVMLGAVKE